MAWLRASYPPRGRGMTLPLSRTASRFAARRIKELEFQQAEINLQKEMRKIELNQIIENIDLKRQEIQIQRT